MSEVPEHGGAPRALPVLCKPPGRADRSESAEPLYYVVAADGLYVGRNHEFFESCVPAPYGPGDAGEQRPFLVPRFPRIPRPVLEKIVGYFDVIAELHRSEASVLLAWDRAEGCVRPIVPQQTATVTEWSDGYRVARGLYYYPPADLPPDWTLFGDVHSHVDYSAYASETDQHDEAHDAGLHVVVGRLYRDPPEFHVEAVVDGVRFPLDLEQVSEGYVARDRNVPDEWLDRLGVEVTPAWSAAGSAHDAGSAQDGGGDDR